MLEPGPQKTQTPSPETSAAGRRPSGPLVEFLYAVQPKAEDLFRQHGVGVEAAEEMLTTALQVLVWKWETVRNREAWLLAVLERKCRLFEPADRGESDHA